MNVGACLAFAFHLRYAHTYLNPRCDNQQVREIFADFFTFRPPISTMPCSCRKQLGNRRDPETRFPNKIRDSITKD